MLAVADPPTVETGLIPGLKYPAAWHRAEEAKERAYLDARIRWLLLRKPMAARFPGGHR